MFKRSIPYFAALAAFLTLASCGSQQGSAASTSVKTTTTTASQTSSSTTTTSTSTGKTSVSATGTTSATHSQTTTSTSSDHSAAGTSATPKHPHIFVIIMENLGYNAAMGTSQLSSLAKKWAYATNYYATTHPSLPNYISLTGGSTFGINSDCTSCFVNEPNLPTELSQKGVSWTAFMQSIPTDCYLSASTSNGLYAGKHDPFEYYDNIRSSKALCANIKPLSQLSSQLKGASSNVSDFTWITPNLCNDGHNCSPSTAGAWLDSEVNQIVASSAWKDGGALYVTWDEGNGGDNRGLASNMSISSSGGGGHVLTLVIEPGLTGGKVISQPFDHYALLKTIETNFGIGQLGQSANPKLQTLP